MEQNVKIEIPERAIKFMEKFCSRPDRFDKIVASLKEKETKGEKVKCKIS